MFVGNIRRLTLWVPALVAIIRLDKWQTLQLICTWQIKTFYNISYGTMTISIMTFSMITLSIMSLFATLSIIDNQHNDGQHNVVYCYAECHLCSVSIILSVTNNLIMLSVIFLNVVILSVVAPLVYLQTQQSNPNVTLHPLQSWTKLKRVELKSCWKFDNRYLQLL